MTKKIFFWILIMLLVATLIIFVGWYFYHLRGPLLAKTITNDWQVEANGEYNRIELRPDKSFIVFIDSNPVDSGQWRINDRGQLVLDFVKNTNDRLYEYFRYNWRGVLRASTDGNDERWIKDKR